MKLLKKREIIKNRIIDASQKRLCEDFPLHMHDFFEIEYIISGNGRYVINGREYEIIPNRVFFMTPADFHGVYTEDTELINIMFPYQPEGSDGIFRLMQTQGSRSLTLDGEDAQLVRLLSAELVSATQREGYGYASALLTCLISKIASRCENGAEEPDGYIKKAILYIFESFTRGVTLEGTAAHLGLSKNYLSELFHEQVGMCFKEYTDNIRFDFAARLLMFTDLSVARVYERTGFFDYANFSRRFKQRYGMSPAEYRRVNKKGG